MSNLNLKGLWMPIEILTDKNLSDKEKNIYSLVIFLSQEKQVGDYVEYNVTYTDMYSDTDSTTDGLQGYEFTATDGWRVLDIGNYDPTTKTAIGVKLISTGIPAKLRYYAAELKPFEKDAAGTYEKWAGDSSQRKSYSTDSGCTPSSSNDNYNMYAAAGLYYNFGKIKFSQGTTSIYNEGYYTCVNGKTTGNLAEDEFVVSGKASEVHNLTLAELNKARGKADDLNNTGSTSKDAGAAGLFYLRGLNKYGYTSRFLNSYWLATPSSYTINLWEVDLDGDFFPMTNGGDIGVRPVVSLSSEVYRDGGVWKIR